MMEIVSEVAGDTTMILSMQGQAFVFLVAVVTGFVCGFVFDLFRIIRKAVKHGTVITQIEDVIFWVIASLVMFYTMFTANSGEVRAFSVLGAFLGMVLYFYTISRVIIKVSSKIIEMIKRVLHKCSKSIIMMFQKCKQIFVKMFVQPVARKLTRKGEEP